MNKFANISLTFETGVIEGQSFVHIHITPMILKDWCICLQLLQDNLVEAVTFRHAQSLKKMKVAHSEGNYSVFANDANGLRLTLSACDLDFAKHFFLRYYRDGTAEVDHIDLQTEEGDYICINVDEFMPPVSPEETKRRLGM